MSSETFFDSKKAENRWRNHMRYNYTSVEQITPSVFRVPGYLRETKPEAYVPQIVGLGPYHHFRPDLQLMATKKRAALRDYLHRMKKDLNHFLNLVDQSLVDNKSCPDDEKKIEDQQSCPDNEKKIEDHQSCPDNEKKREDDEDTSPMPSTFEVTIRSCYDRYIDLGEKTLAWILIVDGTFLLHFVDTYLREQETKEHKKYPDAEKLVMDVLMLENQIPIALLLKIRVFLKLSTHVDESSMLLRKFGRFCAVNSPLELTGDQGAAFDKNSHLLNFMYQMIMKNYTEQGHSQSQGEDKNGDPKTEGCQGDETAWIPRLKAVTLEPIEKIKIFAREVTSHGSEILGHAMDEFRSALNTATNAGLKVPGNIQKISHILQNLEKTFQLIQNKQVLPDDKIEIPSATRLFSILNVKFKPLPKECGIGNIDMKIVDRKKYEFYLPVIHMGPNTEVIVRNLVAYEETISKQLRGSTRLRDFVDLMCGLIKTEKDVKLLKKAGIMKIEQGLPLQEIVRICNGITKSHEKPDEKSKVHSTAKEANNHFNNATIVKFLRWLMKGRPDRITASPYLGDYLELDPQAKITLPRKMLGHQSI